MNSNLTLGLKKLNEWLIKNGRDVELLIIGAFALHLNGVLIDRYTEDIDSLVEISDIELLAEIKRIGKELGLDNWLNFQSSDIPLPDGYNTRLKKDTRFPKIKLNFLAIEDLKLLKCSAYHIRCETTNKDYEDLMKIGLNPSDVDKAIDFIRKTNHPPSDSKSFMEKFEQELEETRQNLQKIVKK